MTIREPVNKKSPAEIPTGARRAPPETSDDAVLGGRLVLRQPLRGHRVGHDAILLAAAAAAHPGGHAVDLGAGVGAAGLALARRLDRLRVTLVEIDPELTALAEGNAERNGLAARVRAICLDVAAPPAAFAAAALDPGSVDCVLMNPPFNAAANASPEPGRRVARVASPFLLRQWASTAARLLRADGIVTLIWRADDLGEIFTALAPGFGAFSVLPIHPKPGAAAIRVVVRARKGSRAPLSLLPDFLLADSSGRPTREVEAVLRGGATLPLAEL